MDQLIRKGNVEQFNYFSVYFIWGYFYFSASYWFYKKIKNFYSNERFQDLYISV
ncbi:hypothetical protein [Marinisporobacter balticus]|uniref:Uncharacterized protein n=1 Tax=Marinisporobacter balticus TaxID=2018667 RepID=A0A4R2KMM8_9FIRM|nr:hypothetical protein [Marinisporobacter balticus]TCO73807.1 hypothetical protein EV214_11442 [Marinisporobacter balticus]